MFDIRLIHVFSVGFRFVTLQTLVGYMCDIRLIHVFLVGFRWIHV